MKPRSISKEIDLPWVQLWKHLPMFTKFIIPQLIIGLGAGLMQPFMNIYFRHVYEKPDNIIAITFSLGSIAMALAQFGGAPLTDRFGKIRTFITSQFLSVPFLITLGVGAWVISRGNGDAEVWFIIASVAFIFRLALMNLANPVYQTFVLEQIPEDVQALAMSLNSLSFQFGWFIMPKLSGWLQVEYGTFGFVYIYFTVAVLYLTAIILERIFFHEQFTASRNKVASVPFVAGD